jgi:hypothetical protein
LGVLLHVAPPYRGATLQQHNTAASFLGSGKPLSYAQGVATVSLSPPDHAHGSQKKHAGGRPRLARLWSTNKFRELCQRHGPEALGIIMDIARHGEPDGARYLAAKWLIERGYGGPESAPADNPSIVQVITGVRGDAVANPPQLGGPIMPDGTNVFEKHATPAPQSARPIPRAPAVEPVQHRLFEVEDKGSS